MVVPLRVLIVEDSIADAELTLAELRLGGYEPVYERVDTPEAMKAALERQNWEIILSDYVMPRFSGPAALKLLQEMGVDLPFIVITGQVGEETAVEAMKAGANDYVLKANLVRLVPAVQRERLLQEIKAQRELFRMVVENAPAGIALLRGPNFVYDLVNRFYQAIAPGKVMLGRTVAEVWPELADQVLPLLQHVLHSGERFDATDMRLPVLRVLGSTY